MLETFSSFGQFSLDLVMPSDIKPKFTVFTIAGSG